MISCGCTEGLADLSAGSIMATGVGVLFDVEKKGIIRILKRLITTSTSPRVKKKKEKNENNEKTMSVRLSA